MPSSRILTAPRKTTTDPAWWNFAVLWQALPALLLVAAVFVSIQTATGNIIGVDGYYHIKVASLVREQGPRIEFPWLRFTILNENAYSDHHLLFHILQAPFTVLDLRLAAKIAAFLFATLCFWGCYLFMATSGVRWPLAWLAVMLAATHPFLWRHSMARPQSLALLLMVVALWLILERRLRWLIPLGFASAWLFDGFILTLIVPLAALAAGLLLERRLDWRPLAYLALGTGLGLLIHPYFPRNVVFAALHLLPKSGLFGQQEVSVGAEWYRYSARGFAERAGVPFAVMIVGLVPVLTRLWRRERLDIGSLTLTLVAIGFLALQVRSRRIIEYFPAFAALLAAWTWSFIGLPLADRPLRALRRWRGWLTMPVGLLLAGWLVQTVDLARHDATGAPANAQIESYREASHWLVTNTARGSLVYNTDWDDFPQLFFWNSHNAYVLGLDATFMSLYDAELYRTWRSISSGSMPNPSAALRERFGAEHVLSDTRHNAFLRQAAADPGLEEVFRSPTAVVFRVRAAGP